MDYFSSQIAECSLLFFSRLLPLKKISLRFKLRVLPVIFDRFFNDHALIGSNNPILIRQRWSMGQDWIKLFRFRIDIELDFLPRRSFRVFIPFLSKSSQFLFPMRRLCKITKYTKVECERAEKETGGETNKLIT